MNKEQALKILTTATALIKTNREDHLNIMNALEHIKINMIDVVQSGKVDKDGNLI